MCIFFFAYCFSKLELILLAKKHTNQIGINYLFKYMTLVLTYSFTTLTMKQQT